MVSWLEFSMAKRCITLVNGELH